MYRSLVRLSFCLFLLSLILPMDLNLTHNDGSHISAIGLFARGFFTLFDQSRFFTLLGWLTNGILLAAYARSFFLGRSISPWLIGAGIILIIVMALTDPICSLFGERALLKSPAFLVWFSAHLSLLVAAFLSRGKKEHLDTPELLHQKN